MPTKEEILKVHEDKYDVFLEEGSDYGINPIYGAMEEYAKQEAVAFAIFSKYDIRILNLLCKEDFIKTSNHLWNEYQKSKLK